MGEEGEDDEINDALRELARNGEVDVHVEPNKETSFSLTEKGIKEAEEMLKDPDKLPAVWGIWWNLMVSEFEKDKDIFAFANAIIRAEKKTGISNFIENALEHAKERGITLKWKVKLE